MTTSSSSPRWLLAVGALVVLLPSVAEAGGMTLPARGARPMGRAGSFVAGADDGGALYYNPAGLADIDGISLLVDGALVFQQVHYDRVDSGGVKQQGQDASIDLLPIPTLALTWKPKRADWLTVAGGIWVPYLGLNSWKEDGPQRYSSITLNGSLLIVMELAAAFRINEHFWLGVGLQNMYLNFRSRKMLSACPSEVDCAPEDPSFDSLTEIEASSAFTPSGIVGATLAYPKFRAGLSVQLPFFVRADGTVRSRLPTNPMFDGSNVVGNSVSLDFDLPLIARAGFEYRPIKPLRLEIGFDYESWSIQDRFTITPHNIYIDHVPGIGQYYLHTMYEERHLDDTFAIHLGGEIEAVPNRFIVRAGYLLETSATPDATASVLVPDGLHNMIAVGLGLKMGPMRFDVGYSHIFTLDRDVAFGASQSYQVNPIQPNLKVGVGGGHYHVSDDIIAGGLEGRF
jgi:long-chain fatty acid transport protein